MSINLVTSDLAGAHVDHCDTGVQKTSHFVDFVCLIQGENESDLTQEDVKRLTKHAISVFVAKQPSYQSKVVDASKICKIKKGQLKEKAVF